MKYPKEYLNEIKLRLKVSQVVGKSVQLQKRGKEFIGLSPFKNEKSPSFTVSDEKEFYHCFSTGEHGNIFDFLMKTKSMGFGEAVKILAADAGMPLYKFSNFDQKKEKFFLTYKNIFREYRNFFHLELFKTINKEYLDYLTSRGLNRNVIEEFGLGYVPWKNSFYNELLKKYTEEEINSTGLYYKSDKTKQFIDRFNSRIIFPINNLTGETIAFGGRIVKESKLAKYINSPETEFYKKGKMIFNLDNAKSMRSETSEVIIVEGYMDVVSLQSAGIKNVISNSGTALTESQIELIWKFFSNPIVCLDGDESGQKAASRIAERLFPLINETNKIYFSILPKNEDPDDFIKKNGKEYFLKFLKSKKIIQKYIWDLYASNLSKNDPYAISKFEKTIKKMCYSIKDEVLRKYILEDYLEKIKELTPIQNSNKYFQPYKNFKRKEDFKVLNETKKLYQQKNSFTKEQLNEHSLLYIMINHPNAAMTKIEELSELKLSSEENNELKKELLENLLRKSDSKVIQLNINKKFDNLVAQIEKNSNLKNIIEGKNVEEKAEMLEEFFQNLKEMNQLKEIEFLESKVAKNLDESSYTELIKLKNQLNRE
jgi:DNA primase